MGGPSINIIDEGVSLVPIGTTSPANVLLRKRAHITRLTPTANRT